jgi:hypothetical protein
VLLSKEFPEVGGQGETFEESLWDEVQRVLSLALGLACSRWVEMREVQSPDNRSQSRVLSDMSQKFGEDPGVRNGDMLVECCKSCSMHAM